MVGWHAKRWPWELKWVPPLNRRRSRHEASIIPCIRRRFGQGLGLSLHRYWCWSCSSALPRPALPLVTLCICRRAFPQRIHILIILGVRITVLLPLDKRARKELRRSARRQVTFSAQTQGSTIGPVDGPGHTLDILLPSFVIQVFDAPFL
jgi:hypothetical protein